MTDTRASRAESAPTPARPHRATSIDVARGVALLGIFAINLPDMAYPEDLVLYPSPPSVTSGVDRWILIVSEIIFSGKMRGLFALIFGVSAALYVKKIRQRSGPGPAIGMFYRRLLWLGAFGLVNAYIFLWWGDILFQYAVLGAVLFPLLSVGWRTVLFVMIASLSLLVLPHALEYRDMHQLQSDLLEVQASRRAGNVVEAEDMQIVADWQSAVADRRPDPDYVDEAVMFRDGNYARAFWENASYAFEEQTVFFFKDGLADILFYMTLGVFLVKIGLVGQAGIRRLPLSLAGATAAVGLSISTVASIQAFEHYLDPVAAPFWRIVFELGRVPLVFGYLTLLAAMASSGTSVVTQALAATGRMALTNYLIQSIIGLVLFHGFGLGLFNVLNRLDLLVILCLVWGVQITVSAIWLRFFHHGPFEWLWRCLTTWTLLPLLRVRGPGA